MTEAHRRHLAVSIRYIGGLLEEADRAADVLTEERRRRVQRAIDDVRHAVARFGERLALDTSIPAIDVFHVIRVQLSVASVSAAEMRSRPMRGYGPLEPDTARDLDAACDALESAIVHAQQIVEGAIP